MVVQEIFGANPHIRSVAERFAAEGYAVLAPSFFDLLDGPDADPDALPYDADGVKQGLERVGALGMERALEVVRAAATRLAPTARWAPSATAGAARWRCCPQCAWGCRRSATTAPATSSS